MSGAGEIDFDLTQEFTDNTVATLKALREELPSKELSKKKKAALAKMGPKSLEFGESTLNHALQNPHLVPSAAIDLEAWKRDFFLARRGQTILAEARSLVEGLEDACTLAGGEAMEASLLYYGVIQALANKLPGLKSVAVEFGKRFKHAKAADSEAQSEKTEAVEE